MKTKRYLIIVLLSIFGICPISAQDNNLQEFVGVWNPSKTGGKMGNIKISIREGKLYIQMKMDNSVKKIDDVAINGDTITWSYVDEKNYGKWYLGRWWETNEIEILVAHNDGSVGSNGAPTEIYVRNKPANMEIECWGFKGVLNDDELQISSRYYGDYYSDGTKVFSQSSNWILESTYTNW